MKTVFFKCVKHFFQLRQVIWTFIFYSLRCEHTQDTIQELNLKAS